MQAIELKEVMKQVEVAVIGGGAAGLVAAISAARAGAKAVIIEHMDRVGKKILATGNGKCNYTNEAQGVSCYRGENPAFVVPVFKQFGFEETVAFFEELGIYPKIKNGYYYPASEQASSVLEVLRMELSYLKVEEKTSCEITDIKKQKNGFLIDIGKEKIEAKSIIFATGLLASPKTGSDGSSFPYIEKFGHHFVDIVPALVQLQGKQSFFKALAGIRAENSIKLYIENRLITSERGELQLTDFGISGIPVFQLSRYATKALKQKKKVYALLDFMPDMEETELENMIRCRFRGNAHDKTAGEALIGLLNKKLAGVLLKEAGIDVHCPAIQVSEKQCRQLCALIKALRVDIVGSKNFEQAQVCAGGVSTDEIDNETLMSKRMPGVYFAGEVIDIDGTCGGYNLQWAWSSGYVAGLHAAQAGIFQRN
ncbi:MAG: NAD(P)/FAD-dependent oxidoreductase [Clostridiales bacterium]|nr:NAD(P)/FAD-dependent oxidoreductase [Clostridiales bacterium]